MDSLKYCVCMCVCWGVGGHGKHVPTMFLLDSFQMGLRDSDSMVKSTTTIIKAIKCFFALSPFLMVVVDCSDTFL